MRAFSCGLLRIALYGARQTVLPGLWSGVHARAMLFSPRATVGEERYVFGRAVAHVQRRSPECLSEPATARCWLSTLHRSSSQAGLAAPLCLRTSPNAASGSDELPGDAGQANQLSTLIPTRARNCQTVLQRASAWLGSKTHPDGARRYYCP